MNTKGKSAVKSSNRSTSKSFDTPKLKIDSALRGVNTVCSQFTVCGGCQLLDLKYEETLKAKEMLMKELLGSFCKIQPIIGMEEPYHYRNKSHFTYAINKQRQVVSGMYEERSHRVVRVDHCQLNHETANNIALTIRDLMKSFKMLPYNEDNGTGFLRHVLIKTGFKTGQVMVVLVISSPVFPSKNNFVKALREKHPEITTILANVNSGRTSMVLGQKEILLYGKGFIEDRLCDVIFQISAKSFYQINPIQTEKLYKTAVEYAALTGREIVLDAYSGIGTIGLIASAMAHTVIGVELNKDAVTDAIQNAKNNRIKNAIFKAGDAGDFMVQMASQNQKLDVVFMDPPRSGSDDKFLKSVLKAKPETVVYVSCNPVTLARDLKTLVSGGYKVKAIQPVDMFPWTEHVEAIILMTRSGKNGK